MGTCGFSLTINNNTAVSNDGSFGSEQMQNFGICSKDEHCDDGDPCTYDTCDITKKMCNYDIDCSHCNKVPISIVINTDQNPYYFSWKLSNDQTNEAILSGGPYQKSYTNYEHVGCLQEGQYIFTAFDSQQDGLTECYGNNTCGYHLSVNDRIEFESDDGNFDEKEHSFDINSISPTSSPSIVPRPPIFQTPSISPPSKSPTSRAKKKKKQTKKSDKKKSKQSKKKKNKKKKKPKTDKKSQKNDSNKKEGDMRKNNPKTSKKNQGNNTENKKVNDSKAKNDKSAKKMIRRRKE